MLAHPRTLFRLLILALLSATFAAGSPLHAEELRAAIYVMKRDASGLRKVAQVDGYKEHFRPSWSHDGKRLAFDALDGSQTKRLFVVNADGTGLKQIGETESPDWSPDDKQIAFHFRGDEKNQQGVYVQNLDGQGRVRVSAGFGPRWSPDGGRIAYTDMRNLIVLDLVTGEERPLLGEPVQQVMPGFDWSPDGKRLAVVIMRNRKKELWIVAADRENTKIEPRLKLNLDQQLSWSRDGSRIAISADRKLSLLEPDGKGAHRLPDQRGESVEPAWSPDGQWLAFSGNHPELSDAAR
jgi:Tol biopolymer transport system component